MPRKTRVAEPQCSPPPVASMRPRPDAAENTAVVADWLSALPGFNEAAARCRGKHTPLRFRYRGPAALQ